MDSSISNGIEVSQSRGRLVVSETGCFPTGKPQIEECLVGRMNSSGRLMTPGLIIGSSGVPGVVLKQDHDVTSSTVSVAASAAAVSDYDEYSASRARTESSQSVASTISSNQSSGSNSPTWTSPGEVGGGEFAPAEVNIRCSFEGGTRTTTRAAASGAPKVQSSSSFPKTGKRGCPQQFPRKLYDMLEEQTFLGQSGAANMSMISASSSASTSVPATKPLPACIQWVSSGKAFVITDMPAFTTHVLPHYFKTTKFSSFQRNLNLYGFSKVIRGVDRGSYFNPNFSRDNETNLVAVKRVKRPRKKAQFEIGGGGYGAGYESNLHGGGRSLLAAQEVTAAEAAGGRDSVGGASEVGAINALALLAKACTAGE